MRVSFGELPEQKIALQERLAFNLLQPWCLGKWHIPFRQSELPWIHYVLIPMNHLVAKGTKYVLDVPIVYEKNKLVVVWIIVSRLDEQFVLWIWSLIKNNPWNWLCLKSNLLEILEQLLNPIVEHVYLVFTNHDMSIYNNKKEMVNTHRQ